MERLSQRLMTLCEMVPRGAKIVDVGTDHALVPTYLVLQKVVPRAIASDVSEGPCRAAERTVAAYGLEGHVIVRQGPGLTTVAASEVDTVIIAGMGGASAIQILRESQDILKYIERIIIQPMNASSRVRMSLFELGFNIERETVLNDDGRLYEIICFARGQEGVDDPSYRLFPMESAARDCAYIFGPLNLSDKTPEVIRLVQSTLWRWERASSGMKQSQTGLMDDKRRTLDNNIGWMTAWLNEAKSEGWERVP